MTLRYSFIDIENGIHEARYKCKPCGYFVRFMIEEEDGRYLKKILDLRDGNETLIPTLKSWAEDKEIEKQLKAFGYYGRR
jgi:hypothetical protein